MQLNDEVERMDEVAQRIIFSPEVKELFCQKFSSEQDEELYDNELELAEPVSYTHLDVYKRQEDASVTHMTMRPSWLFRCSIPKYFTSGIMMT